MSTYEPLDIRSQERTREDQARQAAIELANESEDLKWIMSSKRGRKFMWRLLDQTIAPLGDPFDTNALLMARKCGDQRFGMRMQSLILLGCPELYAQMVKEQTNGNNGNTSSGDTSPKSN